MLYFLKCAKELSSRGFLQEEFLNLINATDSEPFGIGGVAGAGHRGDRQRGVPIEVTQSEREAIERVISFFQFQHLYNDLMT